MTKNTSKFHIKAKKYGFYYSGQFMAQLTLWVSLLFFVDLVQIQIFIAT